MSQGNDIFDLLSGPPSPAVQQPLQSLQFNMAAPPPASSSGGSFSPNYNIDLSLDSSSSSGLGGLGQTNSSPFSSMSQQSGSIFDQTPQQSSVFGQMATGQNTETSSSVFGQMPDAQISQSSSLFGQTPGSQPAQHSTSLFDQMPAAQNSQQPGSLFGQVTQHHAPFGQNDMSAASAFGQNTQASPFGQNTQFGSQPGQTTQTSLPFGQSAQPTSQFGQGAQTTPIFGQGAQATSQFGQNAQPTSLLGQSTQPTSQFGQGTQSNSPFGQGAQPTSRVAQGLGAQPAFAQVQGAQQSSPFGQVQGAQQSSPFGQVQGAQQSSPFGQVQGAQQSSPFGQVQGAQQSSPFGQVQGAQQSSPFAQGQGAQQCSQFGQGAQPTSPFEQIIAPGQNTQQPMPQFATFPNMSGITTQQSSMNSFPMGGAFSSSPNHVPQQPGPDPFAIFSSNAGSGSITNTTTSTSANNDDFFAAFSSPAPSPAPATTAPILKSPSSSALDDSFLNAFSQSSTIASPPAPAPSSNSMETTGSDFDPFGLMSSEKPSQPQAAEPQQAEPLFDAFSSKPVPRQPTPENLDNNDDDDEEEEEEGVEESSAVDGQTEVKADSSNLTAKQEITDPVLREINDRFGGRWKLVRSDPYDEFLKSIGIGLVHRKRAGKANPEQSIHVKPDGEINVTIRSTFHSQAYVFQLNEEKENLVEKMPQSVFCSYSNEKLYLQMSPPDDTFGKTQEVERFINESNEMVQIHSSGAVSCRRYFAKLDGVASKAAAQQATDSKTEDSPSAKTTTATPTIRAPLSTQKTPTQEAPRSPRIQQKSLVVETPSPKPAKPAPIAVMDLSKTVAALGDSSPTTQSSPDAVAVAPAKTAMTPGQLLLQNLHGDEVEDQADEQINITIASANGAEDKLVFMTVDEMTAESEA